MTVSLEKSYRHCERVARSKARNFYLSFLTLPREPRRAMCAVYAFLRHCDDLADDAAVVDREAALTSWRAAFRGLLAGQTGSHPALPAVADTIKNYSIPPEHFEAVMDGAEMDLRSTSYRSFTDLYPYCYRVASAVGLIILRIYGADSPESARAGEACGIAFQLTNIIRDVREDCQCGRVYLPLEDLERFGCPPSMLAQERTDDALRRLLRFEADRAEDYYRLTPTLLDHVQPWARASLSTMICVYHRLLTRMRKRDFDVLQVRVSVPLWTKLGIVYRCWRSPAAALQRELEA